MVLRSFIFLLAVCLSQATIAQESQSNAELALPGVTHVLGQIEAIAWLDAGNATHWKQFGEKSNDVKAAFSYMGVALGHDSDFRQAYLDFRDAKPDFSTELNPARALEQHDVPTTASEILEFLDQCAEAESKEDAIQVFHRSDEIISFSPNKLSDKYYRFIVEAIAIETLKEWLKNREDLENDPHQDVVSEIQSFVETYTSEHGFITYSAKHEAAFELVKMLMAYRLEEAEESDEESP